MRPLLRLVLLVPFVAAAPAVATAADLPTRRAPPVYIPPPLPVFTWTGFFLGGNAGATFDNSRGNNSFYFPAGSIAGSTGSAGRLTTSGARNNNLGFTGGGQIGYNYELGGGGLGGLGGFGLGGLGGGLVIGVVADAQYRDNRNNVGDNYTFTPNSPLTVGNAFVRVAGLPRTVLVNNGNRNTDDFFGTVRGRVGIAFERAMIFGSGGFAYDTRSAGYTYGGGLEYMITNNISVGAEYLRVNLNRGFNETAVYTAPARLGAGTLTLNSTGGREEFNVARAFLNYKFTTYAAAPVVARY